MRRTVASAMLVSISGSEARLATPNSHLASPKAVSFSNINMFKMAIWRTVNYLYNFKTCTTLYL